MLPASIWKLAAGAGLAVGGLLAALAIALPVIGLVQGGSVGFGTLFPLSIPLWVFAVPLVILGRIAWRRAHQRQLA